MLARFFDGAALWCRGFGWREMLLRVDCATECRHACRISVPLAWYPTLMLATPDERSVMHISSSTVHWPLLDCDLGSEGILRGNKEADYFARRAWKRHAASSGKNPAFAA